VGEAATWAKKLLEREGDTPERPGAPRPFANIPAATAGLRALVNRRSQAKHREVQEKEWPSAAQLRERREALGLGQRELSERAGISRGVLSEIERGGRRTGKTLPLLVRALEAMEAEHRRGARFGSGPEGRVVGPRGGGVARTGVQGFQRRLPAA
jgi:DNA-binding XRE family transcriptional regulator